jgi:hypothetical protein
MVASYSGSPSSTAHTSRVPTRRRSTILLLLLAFLIVGLVIRQTSLAFISTRQDMQVSSPWDINASPHRGENDLSASHKHKDYASRSSSGIGVNNTASVTLKQDMEHRTHHWRQPQQQRGQKPSENSVGGAELDHTIAPTLPFRNRGDDSTTFSACLLVMDDNHFLIEWLAYHYHFLPLRYVVIAVDPRSRTSPKHVLDRWSNGSESDNRMMTIARWSDRHFMPHKLLPQHRDVVNENDATAKFVLHRERQRHFYPTCLAALRQANRSWTMVIDIDEYVVLNQNYVYYNETIKRQQQQQQERPALIQAIRNSNQYYNYTDTACITMPRLRFGSYEDNATAGHETSGSSSSSINTNNRYAPDGFRDQDFMTLQWHWRAGVHNRKDNRNPKSMVDVSAIVANFSRKDTDAHRPVRSACPKRNMYIMNRDSPFVVHHYSGTLEQYNFRRDAREGLKQRNEQRYREYQQIHEAHDDTICDWVKSFVKANGFQQSKKWLGGVGNVSYTPPP